MTDEQLAITSPKPQDYGALEPAPWGILNVITVMAGAIAAFVVVILTVAVIARAIGLMHDSKQVLGAELLATFLFDLCLLGMALAVSLSQTGMSLRKYGYRGFRASESYLPAIGVAGTYIILLLYIGIITGLHLPRLAPVPNLPKGIFQARYLIVPAIMEACLVAPVIEESFFRGFVFRGLLGRTLVLGRRPLRFRVGFWAAALLSGALFAAFHGELGLLVPFTFVGALFAWIFWRTGSLWPGIIAHAGFNAVSLSLAIATQH